MANTVLTAELKSAAAALGFGPVGVCPAVTPQGLSRFHDWLAAGYAGEMNYLETRLAAYEHPRYVLDGVRSIIVLALNYRTAEPAPTQPGRGRVSRYAWGIDYHELIRSRLDELAHVLRHSVPSAAVRGVVDTAPLLERELAQLAGLGWIGKNTLLLNKRAGSWFFLSALLTDVELEFDEPHHTDHCGTCRACLDACPTGAFVDAYVLDPRRCISYLTIESREAFPRELRSHMGDWLFGCDICQEVCPWNREAPVVEEQAFQPRGGQASLNLAELFYLDDSQFRARFRHTPLWRAKRRGILRNAANVLGNQIAVGKIVAEMLPALVRGLNDEEPLVRGACACALANGTSSASEPALRARRSIEQQREVLDEIDAALDRLGGSQSANSAVIKH